VVGRVGRVGRAGRGSKVVWVFLLEGFALYDILIIQRYLDVYNFCLGWDGMEKRLSCYSQTLRKVPEISTRLIKLT